MQCTSMRLLPKRSDNASRRAVETKAEAYRCRYRYGDAREYLSLRHLSANQTGNQPGSGGEKMNRIDVVTRRTFLGGMFSAGAFVLAARIVPVKAMSGTLTSDFNGAAWHQSVYLGIDTDGTVI